MGGIRRTGNGRDAGDHEHGGGDPAHQLHRDFSCQRFADQNRGYVCNHHAHGRPAHDGSDGVVSRRQRNGSELSLVAHFREEERNQRGDECPSAVRRGLIVQRIGVQRPQTEANEHQADDPGQQQWRQPCGREHAQPRRECVIGNRGSENSEDDGSWLFQPRCKDKG